MSARPLPTLTREAMLLVGASNVLDEMWRARYHGGSSSGRQGNERWVRLRALADEIAKWRKANDLGESPTRLAERKTAARARAALAGQEKP